MAYPYVVFLYGSDEIWVIDVNNEYDIHRYFFESQILGIENKAPH